MIGIDYQRVEQELQQHVQPLSSLPLSGLQAHGWSSGPLGLCTIYFYFIVYYNHIGII